MKIKEIRESLGYSQKDLAGILGVSPSNIYNYENNRTEPSIDMLIKLSNILNVSIDELVGIEQNRTIVSAAPSSTDIFGDEATLLSCFRKLGTYEKEAILIQIKALAGAGVKVLK